MTGGATKTEGGISRHSETEAQIRRPRSGCSYRVWISATTKMTVGPTNVAIPNFSAVSARARECPAVAVTAKTAPTRTSTRPIMNRTPKSTNPRGKESPATTSMATRCERSVSAANVTAAPAKYCFLDHEGHGRGSGLIRYQAGTSESRLSDAFRCSGGHGRNVRPLLLTNDENLFPPAMVPLFATET